MCPLRHTPLYKFVDLSTQKYFYVMFSFFPYTENWNLNDDMPLIVICKYSLRLGETNESVIMKYVRGFNESFIFCGCICTTASWLSSNISWRERFSATSHTGFIGRWIIPWPHPVATRLLIILMKIKVKSNDLIYTHNVKLLDTCATMFKYPNLFFG